MFIRHHKSEGGESWKRFYGKIIIELRQPGEPHGHGTGFDQHFVTFGMKYAGDAAEGQTVGKLDAVSEMKIGVVLLSLGKHGGGQLSDLQEGFFLVH
jgi:hypothetical protein